MLFLKFITNPLSYTFYVASKQKIDLYGQMSLLFIALLSVYIGLEFNSEKIILITFSLSYSIIYIIYLVYSYSLSKGKYP